MTSGYPDAQTVESLRIIATRLHDAGPTTARRRVVAHALGLGAAVAAAIGPFGLAGDVAATVLGASLFLHADAMQHEAVHRHVARTATGNRLVGLLASVPMLVPYSLYEAFHIAHHAHTARAGDPEGRHEPAIRWPWLIESWRSARFWGCQWVSSLQMFGGRSPRYVRTDRQRRSVRVDTAITVVAGTALVRGSFAEPAVRWVWLAPFLIYVLLLFPIFHTYEHAGAEARVEAGAGVDPASLTSTLRLPRLVSSALWHATLHTAHHAFPTVPWQRLPELQVCLDEHLRPEVVYENLIDYLHSPNRPDPDESER